MNSPAPLPEPSPRPLEHMVKMNLPSMLGRRDALGFLWLQQTSLDILSKPLPERVRHYAALERLATRILNDTGDIVALLSQSATAKQEGKYYTLVTSLRQMIKSVHDVALLQLQMENDQHILKDMLSKPRPGFRKHQKCLATQEGKLFTMLMEFLQSSEEGRKRHREYTKQNFNTHNAGRYQRAFTEFRNSAIFTDFQE